MVDPKIVIIDGQRGRWIPEAIAEDLWCCATLDIFGDGDYQNACTAKSALYGPRFLKGDFHELEVLIVETYRKEAEVVI